MIKNNGKGSFHSLPISQNHYKVSSLKNETKLLHIRFCFAQK